MYIGGRSDGNKNRGELKIPEQYSGSALSRTDPLKLELLSEKDALRHAEEVFQRGYVFEEGKTEAEFSDASVPAASAAESLDSVKEVMVSPSSAPLAEEVAVSGKAHTLLPTGGGLLSGLIESVKIEHIILIALILILYDSKADDQLLVMLAILFFC